MRGHPSNQVNSVQKSPVHQRLNKQWTNIKAPPMTDGEVELAATPGMRRQKSIKKIEKADLRSMDSSPNHGLITFKNKSQSIALGQSPHNYDQSDLRK